MVKRYCNDNDSRRYPRRKKPKRRALHKFICFLLILCCLTIFAIGLFKNYFPFSISTQPPVNLPDKVVINTDSDTSLTDNTQSKADTTAQSNIDEAAWCFILVNKWNPIPNDYKVDLTKLDNGQSVDKRIYPALQAMFDAARNDGVYPVVASGYRTENEQQRLLDEKIADYKTEGYSAKEAKTKAEAWVAVPGTSEHQLGIAVDINADDTRSTGEEVYKWLNQNSYTFGFICRYSADKTEITGVIGEAWHYRYVGVQAATEIYNQGICLEEYLDKIK